MNCQSCGRANPEGVKFCGERGNALKTEVTCAGCGSANPPGIKFCHACGAALAASTSPTATPMPAPAPALPSSFGGGRYEVKGFLGEGGRKRVYLAHDEKLDRDVAVAMIKTEGIEEDGIYRIKRAATSMGRLGVTPIIVTVCI